MAGSRKASFRLATLMITPEKFELMIPELSNTHETLSKKDSEIDYA